MVAVPEHGALLVVAWLLFNGHDALALELVTELYPLMDRLRFYPVLTEAPPASSAVVHLRTVARSESNCMRCAHRTRSPR